MKLSQSNFTRSSNRRRGSAVLVMLAFLSIIGVYLAGNVRALRDVKQELKLTEQRQIRRLQQVTLQPIPVQSIQTNLNSEMPGTIP